MESPLALLLIDVINDFDFPEGLSLVAHAQRAAPRIELLAQRARHAHVPVIYVNDNFGHWCSDFRATISRCSERTRPGAELVKQLSPQQDDFFVLKPMHSGFFHTPLELLLDELGCQVLVLCGFAANSCVVFTAHDAYMRGFSLVVPSDTTAANHTEQCSAALAHLETALHADTRDSEQLDFEQLRASCGNERQRARRARGSMVGSAS